jgi:hypothetical protein
LYLGGIPVELGLTLNTHLVFILVWFGGKLLSVQVSFFLETDILLRWLLSKGARQVKRSHLCSRLIHMDYRETSLASVVLYGLEDVLIGVHLALSVASLEPTLYLLMVEWQEDDVGF